MDKISSFSQEVIKIMPYLIRGLLKKMKQKGAFSFITIPQFVSLDLIETKGSLKMKELAKELNITLPAATKIVNKLVKLGLVKREFDYSDRRVIKVVLTQKGKKILEETKKERKKVIEKVFEKLSLKEREIYLNILRKIKNIFYPEEK
jgi:DNA-binding MarR family transcriptional regulator